MNTILIPTDFSATAKNAMHYAAAFAKQAGIKKIVLYNAYQPTPVSDPVQMSLDLYEIEEFKEISRMGLENAKADIEILCGKDILVEVVSEYNAVSAGIFELAEKHQTDLIIMGITGAGKIEEILAGSNTIHIAKHATVPVITVPGDAVFSSVKNILLACDFKKVIETTPVEPIKNMLDATGAKLSVLYVTSDNDNSIADVAFESSMLDKLLQGYHPEYYFSDHPDFTEGINQFASENDIDLIITIPKKHGLFEGLFKRSHTNTLVFHTHVPLMVVHE